MSGESSELSSSHSVECENRTRRTLALRFSLADATASTGTTVAGQELVGLGEDGSRPVYLCRALPLPCICSNFRWPCRPLIRKLLPDENSPRNATVRRVDAALVRSARI